jgi:hypothetical protein
MPRVRPPVRAAGVEGHRRRLPSCKGSDLEQLISGFAVSSESTREINLQRARARYKNSKDLKDKKVAETEDIREHIKEYMPPKA